MDGWDGKGVEESRRSRRAALKFPWEPHQVYLSGLGYDGAAPAAEQPKAPPAEQPKRCITAHLLWPSDHP